MRKRKRGEMERAVLAPSTTSVTTGATTGATAVESVWGQVDVGANRREIWKSFSSVMPWIRLSLKVLVFGYAVGVNDNGCCDVCTDHWRSAARICNECGAAVIWQQRLKLWTGYSQRVMATAKTWVWPEVSQLSDLDVRCAAMRAFLMKKNCFLNAATCVDVYRRLTRQLPNMFEQLAEAQPSGFKNIIQTLICCFHNETAFETIGIYNIIDTDRRAYGVDKASINQDDAGVQLHKAVEVASRFVPRRNHLDALDFNLFLSNGPISLLPTLDVHSQK